MSDCQYCGRPAGFLRKKHRQCEQQHQQGRALFLRAVESAAAEGSPISELKEELSGIQREHYLPREESRKLLVRGWENAVSQALEDGFLSATEEENIATLSDAFNLTQQELNKKGIHTKLVQAGLLRDLMEGKVPDRVKLSGDLPFNFQKSETLIWVFVDVNYYEQKTRKQYVGASQGLSIRVAQGVYYRTSAFKGKPIETTETVHSGYGFLAVTNKHLYFGGGEGKSVRVRLEKIISFEPYSDGIGIQRDAATAKPQIFVTGDGWFTYNLIQNVSNL